MKNKIFMFYSVTINLVLIGLFIWSGYSLFKQTPTFAFAGTILFYAIGLAIVTCLNDILAAILRWQYRELESLKSVKEEFAIYSRIRFLRTLLRKEH